MIDTEKWQKASDETKMKAIETIKEVMADRAVTKSDYTLITDFLFNKIKED